MYAGFDVGGTNARLALFHDTSPHALARTQVRLREDTSAEGVAHQMSAMLQDLLSSQNASWEDLTSVGVGLAAQLNRDGRTVVNAPNLGWRDLDFVACLHHAMPREVPTLLTNDLSALLWGEHQEGGALEGVQDALAVYVGTGVGGAILSQGRLIEGVGGKAGEIGHVKVQFHGRLCGCGERGCLEAYAGGIHLEAMVHEAAHTYGLDGLLREDGVDLGRADAMASTHPALGYIWERATDMLAMAIANACTLLNPEALLLGGGVLSHCADFQGRLVRKMTPLVLASARQDLKVLTPGLGDVAGMLGAARLARAVTL